MCHPAIGFNWFLNVRLVGKGVAVRLSKDAKAEEIYSAIVQVRDDARFRRNIDALADLISMERHKPLDDAIW